MTRTLLARRPGFKVVLGSLTALAVMTTASATALAALPIRVPPLRPPKSIVIDVVPWRQYRTALQQASIAPHWPYGRVTPTTRAELDGLRDDAVAGLARGIEDIVRTDSPSGVTQAREVLWSCARDGLGSTASSLGAIAAGAAPDVTETYLSAAGDCLRGQLSGPADIPATAQYLFNLTADYAKEAGEATPELQDATPAQRLVARQLWLEATAKAVRQHAPSAAIADQAPNRPAPATPSASSSWLPLLGAAALALAAVLFVMWRRAAPQARVVKNPMDSRDM